VPSLRKRHGTPRHQARSGDDGLTDTGRADTSHSTSRQGTRNSRRGALGSVGLPCSACRRGVRRRDRLDLLRRATRLAAIIDWLAQPPHGELDILGLQLAPAFDLGQVTVPGGRALLGEFLADEWVSWYRGCRLERTCPMIPPIRPGGKPLLGSDDEEGRHLGNSSRSPSC
jgi:hypothetical protein